MRFCPNSSRSGWLSCCTKFWIQSFCLFSLGWDLFSPFFPPRPEEWAYVGQTVVGKECFRKWNSTCKDFKKVRKTKAHPSNWSWTWLKHGGRGKEWHEIWQDIGFWGEGLGSCRAFRAVLTILAFILTRASLTADGLGVFSLTSVSALTGLQLLSAALHVSHLHPVWGPFVVFVRQMHRQRWLAVWVRLYARTSFLVLLGNDEVRPGLPELLSGPEPSRA